MDGEGERSGLPLRVAQGVLGGVGPLPPLPFLPLTRAEAQGNDCREALGLQPREDREGVEAAVEQDPSDLSPRLLEVVKGGLDDPSMPPPWSM